MPSGRLPSPTGRFPAPLAHVTPLVTKRRTTKPPANFCHSDKMRGPYQALYNEKGRNPSQALPKRLAQGLLPGCIKTKGMRAPTKLFRPYMNMEPLPGSSKTKGRRILHECDTLVSNFAGHKTQNNEGACQRVQRLYDKGSLPGSFKREWKGIPHKLCQSEWDRDPSLAKSKRKQCDFTGNGVGTPSYKPTSYFCQKVK